MGPLISPLDAIDRCQSVYTFCRNVHLTNNNNLPAYDYRSILFWYCVFINLRPIFFTVFYKMVFRSVFHKIVFQSSFSRFIFLSIFFEHSLLRLNIKLVYELILISLWFRFHIRNCTKFQLSVFHWETRLKTTLITITSPHWPNKYFVIGLCSVFFFSSSFDECTLHTISEEFHVCNLWLMAKMKL